MSVPYDDPMNGGPGAYELGPGSKDGRGARPVTVRVAEIDSLRRLILEGKQLNNCALVLVLGLGSWLVLVLGSGPWLGLGLAG